MTNTSLIKVLFAAAVALTVAFSIPASAQSIDYGISLGTVQSPAGTPLPLATGGFQLYVTNGSFTPSASSTLSDITSNMRLVTDSFTQIDGSPGLFYLGGIFPATSAGNIPTGTQLYILASTSATFSLTAPWALISNSSVDWLSPNANDPFASIFIEASSVGTSIIAAGNGGPGVGAYWQPSGPGTITSPGDASIVLVPEPSTYALLSLAGLALGGYAMRRRRRA